ncbi:hypothetical protein ACJJTC_002987 [Scirpophaga incertulas]
MPASIGVNLRITGHCSQGGRKYMEDLFSVAYQQTEDERDLEYAFFGIYDGHGGSEAAAFAKEHLMDSIVKQRQFWSDNDEDVLKAIRNGYMLTHLNMWKELEKWPKTVTGLPSTAGTTASIAFIRRGKIYIGHVGDSAIVLGYQKDDSEDWAAKPLTLDHKPESAKEKERIQRCGGKVLSKAGVPRVVWNRPRLGHKGPIKKNTPMDEIPFLAVARSLGDLWSYNPQNDEFIVSPDPDVGVLAIDPSKFRCLIFGTDGLWNMISPEGAVTLVQAIERHNEAELVGASGNQPRDWLNPSKSLVDHALRSWSNTRMRADNTSVVTLMLDLPGPPRATVLRSRTSQKPTPVASGAAGHTAPAAAPAPAPAPTEPAPPAPAAQNGLTIMTRFSDAERPAPDDERAAPLAEGRLSVAPLPDLDRADSVDTITNYGNPAESYFMARLLNRTRVVNTLSDVYEEIVNGRASSGSESAREASPPPTTAVPEPKEDSAVAAPVELDDGGIQINEVSSSSAAEAPARGRGRRARPDLRREPPPAQRRVLRPRPEQDEPPAPVSVPASAPALSAAPLPPLPPLPPRPQTRQAAKPRAAPPEPALERVVILGRRAPPPPGPRRPPTNPLATSAPSVFDEESRRATRSQGAAPQLAQKITRSIGGMAREVRSAVAGARPGNCARAPGPARRVPAAPRRAPLRSKENRGAASRRARPGRPAAPAPAPCPEAAAAEVHSTTPEAGCGAPRTLRSRNESASPASKRARCSPAPAPALPPVPVPSAGKAAPERCARALGKRSSGPWAPALALRNRLRRRLAK